MNPIATRRDRLVRLSLCSLPAMLASCSLIGPAPTVQAPLDCDMQGLGQLRVDAQTQVVAVRAFKAGEQVRLAHSPQPHVTTAHPPRRPASASRSGCP
jgi:hypothetical protein